MQVTVTTTGQKIDLNPADLIGSFTSHWRKRSVGLYRHPTKAHFIVSVGYGFNGGSDCIAVEPEKTYSSEIGHFGVNYP